MRVAAQDLPPFAAPSTSRADRAFIGKALQRRVLRPGGHIDSTASVVKEPRNSAAQDLHRDEADQEDSADESCDRAKKRSHANFDAGLARPEDNGFEDADRFSAGMGFKKHVRHSLAAPISRRIGAKR